MDDKFCKVCITSLYNNKPCINKTCKYNASTIKIEDANYSRTVQFLDTEYCIGYKTFVQANFPVNSHRMKYKH